MPHLVRRTRRLAGLTGADLLGAALARHPDVPTALTAWETELRASTLPPVARILQRQLRLHR